jgi:hypothetical protein
MSSPFSKRGDMSAVPLAKKITGFADPALFPAFGLPARLEG